MTLLDPKLINELQQDMNLDRLAKTGLFQKLAIDPDDEPIKNELKLHRAVLDRALVDSFSEFKTVRREIKNWLSLANPDFIDACDRAQLHPKAVFQIFSAIREVLTGDLAKFRKFGKKKDKG